MDITINSLLFFFSLHGCYHKYHYRFYTFLKFSHFFNTPWPKCRTQDDHVSIAGARGLTPLSYSYDGTESIGGYVIY